MRCTASSAASPSTMSSVEPARKTVACSTASRSGWTPSSAGISGKTSAPSGTSAGSASSLISTSRHGRDDGQVVAVLHRRFQVAQVTDVLVVEEQVDEAAHLALVEQARTQSGILAHQVGQHGLNGRSLDLHRTFAFGVLA